MSRGIRLPLKTKTTLITLVLTLLTMVLLAVVSVFAFRFFSISTAEEHARTAAEIVRVSLTESMINGVIHKRGSFLERLTQIKGITDPRVVRSPGVVQQYGDGLGSENNGDAIDLEVMASGRPHFGLVQEGAEPIFRATIPFVADENGNPNCLSCHKVKAGTVLGTVSLTLSLAHLQRRAGVTILIMALIVALFSVLFLNFFRRMVDPLVDTADSVQTVVKRAVEGDFRGRVQRCGEGEVGQIADGLNRLMSHLDEGLSTVNRDVARLMQYETPPVEQNLLVTTTEMVASLVEVAQFKLAVEEDHGKREVYDRLGWTLSGKFGLTNFTIYEVANSHNRMVPVVVDGEADGACRWCSKEILINAAACRTARTGHVVDGIEIPRICSMFRNNGQELSHICIPVIQSGAVGSVVQMVVEGQQGRWLQLLMPLIRVYLREAAPVLESKRLLDTLRESALRDPMTGLHNRRFLEEYVETLVAHSARRKDVLAVLMLDVDHFKPVNDTYGHEAGDLVLKYVAQLLRRETRAADLLVRYGGEEFLIVLRESSPHGGREVAEKIRRSLEETPISIPGATIRKTLSIGVARFPENSSNFWDVIKLADQSLYRAKETGRNQVIEWSGPPEGAG